ncbi:MAG TPA: ribose 5-phosphate isomerase B [Clostridiaceae bacterium]|nr:ribose 5-phosphate isomerase B [Clostridiaceae bacterium]
MNIAIGSDHAGFSLKPVIIEFLNQSGYHIIDHGSYDPNPVDFPDIAKKVCEDILNGKAQRGIMICGTGVGAAIACNKIHGIRASVCHDIYTAHQCVEHDNVNVICLGAQIIGSAIATEMVEEFLQARFSTKEEFRRRVKKLDMMDIDKR